MITIKGIYGREMFETWYWMSVLTQSGVDIGPVITHRFAAADYAAAFEHRARGQLRQGCAELGGPRQLAGTTIQEGRRCSPALHRRSPRSSARSASRACIKAERIIASPQRASIVVAGGTRVLNLCANNYLGLADDSRIIEAAKRRMNQWGFGMASVRFICGTQDVHKRLERKISEFLGTADTILYPSCFDANGGLFETILGDKDAVISDELNHASIIDGVRLCRAKRLRYKNRDMADLETQLKAASEARRRLIATDGVFSMDGYVAPLREICDLADRYDAMVMVDDSHAVGFVGPTGRGTPELHGVTDRVDIITGTLGKALGGASGGFTSGRAEIVDLLRQRSRPYLFSNSVPPAVVGASLKVLDVLGSERRPAGQAGREHGLLQGADDRARIRRPAR